MDSSSVKMWRCQEHFKDNSICAAVYTLIVLNYKSPGYVDKHRESGS
jgi:hypothetical protein